MPSTDPKSDRDRLEAHVRALAAKPRTPGSDAHRIAGETIERELFELGCYVRRDAIASGFSGSCNIVAECETCNDPSRPVFVVGAHYDSVEDSPGADDNATAVAALIEIARHFADDFSALSKSNVHLKLIAFDLEELGFIGSQQVVASLLANQTPIAGMVSLEMLGYTDDRPGSQNLPPVLRDRYPDTGNFIGVIGNENSTALLQRFVQQMRRADGLPVESLVVPGNGEIIAETRLSDHSPFWDAGQSALMITDTSFFRNPHYHRATDTAETIDFEFLGKVTDGVLHAVGDVMSNPLP